MSEMSRKVGEACDGQGESGTFVLYVRENAIFDHH